MASVDEDGTGGEAEEEVLLGGELNGGDRAREDGVDVGRQEALPDCVGGCGAADVGGDGGGPGGIGGRGEGEDLGEDVGGHAIEETVRRRCCFHLVAAFDVFVSSPIPWLRSICGKTYHAKRSSPSTRAIKLVGLVGLIDPLNNLSELD